MSGIFFGARTSSTIPRFVSSASANGLERKMLAVQKRTKGVFAFNIMFNSDDNKFYAWYTVNYDQENQSRLEQSIVDERVSNE